MKTTNGENVLKDDPFATLHAPSGELYDINGAARYLNISSGRQLLLDYIAQARLRAHIYVNGVLTVKQPKVKDYRKLFFFQSDLEAFERTRQQPGSQIHPESPNPLRQYQQAYYQQKLKTRRQEKAEAAREPKPYYVFAHGNRDDIREVVVKRREDARPEGAKIFNVPESDIVVWTEYHYKNYYHPEESE